MSEDIDFKTPKKVRREEGGKRPLRAPGRVSPLGADSADDGAGLEVPPRRPVRPAEDSAPPAAARRPGAVPAGRPRASAPRPRPAPKRAPAREDDFAAAPPEPAPRPRPASKPVRREKSLEGLGRMLKTKREIHGLTRRDVVIKIKIPLDQLEAIEEGRLSSLPPVFAKGFLRAYANELGLDAEAILEDYRQLTGGFKNEPASREALAPRYVETSVGGGGGLGLGVKTLILAMAALVVVVGLVLWLWPGLRYGLGSAVPFLNLVPGFSQTDETKGPYTTMPAGPADGGNDVVLSGQGGDDPFLDDPINDREIIGSISTPPALVPAGGILTITSRSDQVWLEVRVDDQERLFYWLRNGQQMTWQARRSISITTGQANALSANWNGREITPLSSEAVFETTFPQGG